ncbi:MAG: phosphoadenylyl-sulfate reductase [Chloroflexota bacterium]|nr:phosphoadenylyl-sulfate reductase [Chloroflexota bacterium]
MNELIQTDIINQVVDKPTAAELDRLNAELAELGPQGILKWAIHKFGPKLGMACSFGGISCMVLLDMAVRLDPQIRIFYLDPGFLFPETYAFRDEVIRHYGINPQAFRPWLTPEEQAAEYGETLWEHDPDKCCAIRKIEPNQRALEGLQAWVAGLRRDQSVTRQNLRPIEWDKKFNLYKISPLWDWTEEMVWVYLRAEQVPYNPLHDQGYPSLGCTHCTKPVVAGEDSRAGRWSGKNKTECGLHY